MAQQESRIIYRNIYIVELAKDFIFTYLSYAFDNFKIKCNSEIIGAVSEI